MHEARIRHVRSVPIVLQNSQIAVRLISRQKTSNRRSNVVSDSLPTLPMSSSLDHVVPSHVRLIAAPTARRISAQ
jgi:hypothetical protein